jgi:GNAT superfamily N-acetyltransferase
MDRSLRERYLAAQRRRAPAWAAAEECEVVDEPGVFGWAAPAGSAPRGRLWIDEARSIGELAALLEPHRPLIVSADSVVAPVVAELLDGRPEFIGVAEPVTGMLVPLPVPWIPPVPAGLRVLPVLLQDDGGSDGGSDGGPAGGPDAVPLEAVAAAALAADPDVAAAFDVPRFAAHLRRAPTAVLLAAVDQADRVRGTAAAALVGALVGADATVYLVTTDPRWRNRGVASALTARVTARAVELGATTVSLDSSAAGRGLYERLGFQAAVALFSWARVSE